MEQGGLACTRIVLVGQDHDSNVDGGFGPVSTFLPASGDFSDCGEGMDFALLAP